MFSLLMARLGATIVTSTNIGGGGGLYSVTAASHTSLTAASLRQQELSTAPNQPSLQAQWEAADKIQRIEDQSHIKGMEGIVTDDDKKLLNGLKTTPAQITAAQIAEIDGIVDRLKKALGPQVESVTKTSLFGSQQKFSELIETRKSLVTELQGAESNLGRGEKALVQEKLRAVDARLTEKILDPRHFKDFQRYCEEGNKHIDIGEIVSGALSANPKLAQYVIGNPDTPEKLLRFLAEHCGNSKNLIAALSNNLNLNSRGVLNVPELSQAQAPAPARALTDVKREFDGMAQQLDDLVTAFEKLPPGITPERETANKRIERIKGKLEDFLKDTNNCQLLLRSLHSPNQRSSLENFSRRKKDKVITAITNFVDNVAASAKRGSTALQEAVEQLSDMMKSLVRTNDRECVERGMQCIMRQSQDGISGKVLQKLTGKGISSEVIKFIGKQHATEFGLPSPWEQLARADLERRNNQPGLTRSQ